MAEEAQGKIELTRRQAVTAMGAGAVTLAATHSVVAYQAAQWAEQAPRQQADDYAAEIERLKGLLALYEGLEQIGIDAIVAGALTGYKGVLDALRTAVGGLRDAVQGAEGAIANFHDAFASLRAGLKTAEEGVSNVVALLQNAQNWLGQTTSPLEPLLDQVHQFFDDLLGKIPFGVGDNIRKTVDGLIGLVVAIPAMVGNVRGNLLEPLRTGWLSDDNARNIQGALLDPIAVQILQPLKKLLDEIDATLARWESDVATPVQAALDRRAGVRRQIAEYKQQHGLN